MKSHLLTERLTAHVARLIEAGHAAIAAQYRRPNGVTESFSDLDPLGEESRFSPIKGLVHKFPDRVLWKVSYRCAAHCQFCTRHRQIGKRNGDLDASDIAAALQYIRADDRIKEVILSGGDPLYTPEVTLQIVAGLTYIETIRIVRVGTRLPVQSPKSLQATGLARLLGALARLRRTRAVYIMMHVNHPAEIDRDVEEGIALLQRHGMIILSQSVFLKGVNDSETLLSELFFRLACLGVRPYYIYRCDYVRGLEGYVCDPAKERAIMSGLRRHLSGIALPTYVIDVPGKGKIPVPLDFWDGTDLSHCRDFDGLTVEIGID
jgi:lysine 2,3-aminomutase